MKDLRFIVIGAGMAGICALIRLREAGYTNVVAYEKASSLGGTWRDNNYPGLACDSPSHSYTYRFARNSEWSSYFSPGPEILQYLRDVAKKYGVDELIRFDEEVLQCEYDGNRWNIETKNGTSDFADFVIAATGVLHHPSELKIAGREKFKGSCFHSARWDPNAKVDGKRVGVIGSGSTGVQLISALSKRAAKLYHFQRTAQWIMPCENGLYTEEQKSSFRADPALIEQMVDEALIGENSQRWIHGIINKDSDEIKQIEALCLQNLEASVADLDLRAKLRPNYRAGCKRLVFSGEYYSAVQRPNVELVTDNILVMDANGVILNTGRAIELDVLVLATGFDATAFMRPMNVTGRNGASLQKIWAKNPQAYLSVSIPDFPNFFMLNGPNGPVGNFSLVDIAEKQLNYILQLVELVAKGECRAVSVTKEALGRFNAERIEAAKHTIWASGCNSWYLDSEGIPASWPFTYERFNQEMSAPNFRDFFLAT